MFYLLFLASTLFANTEYYAIEAGNMFETYETCYVALDHGGNENPELRKLTCPESFNIVQTYNSYNGRLYVYWSFSQLRRETVERNTRYGESTPIIEEYTLTDEDTCYLKIEKSFSWIVDNGLFGCGMNKIVASTPNTPAEFNIWNEIIINK